MMVYSSFQRTLILSLLAVSSACGSDGTSTLVVNISGVTTDIQRLQLRTKLAGAESVRDYRPASAIGLRLPQGVSGPISITLSGLGADSSVRAAGTSMSEATGAARIDTSVLLSPLSVVQYPLTVQLSGNGGGNVSSVPSGINCTQSGSAQCIANYATGTTITLTATPNVGSTFNGWSGACNGASVCQVTIGYAAAAVSASFVSKSACPSGTFCVDGSAGVGINLWGVWGTDSSNVWAVGDSGAVLRRNASTWQSQVVGTTPHFGIWGTSANSIWTASQGVYFWSGTTWSPLPSGGTYNSIFALDSNNVWLVGNMGVLAKLMGGIPVTQNSGTSAALYRIWALDQNNAWVVGDSVMLRWNGANWQPQPVGAVALRGIWGFNVNNIFSVGHNGVVLKWDGSMWTSIPSGITSALYAVWGPEPSNVFAVGQNGTILKWNGSMWSVQMSGTTANLYGVWGSDINNVWAVGANGTILKRAP